MAAASAASPSRPTKVDYGLDAPGFQRSALFGGLAAMVVGFAAALLVAHGVLPQGFQLASGLVWPGTAFFLTGCIMYWGSKVGKLRLKDKIIASIEWRGDEQVLDVGCGHGLMLLAAAARLTTGSATGVDVWSQVDQADNNPDSTMENARIENVADRVHLESADA
ncbi:MAG: 50S ribosomal protein L11 methyltransferase, partial [Acidobacteriaceae bacterium]